MEKRKSGTFTWLYLLAALLALGLAGVGVYFVIRDHSWSILAAGTVALVGVLITWPIAIALGRLCREMGPRQETIATAIAAKLDQLYAGLNLISEQQLLSDRAKAVAFREKDREAVRKAIEEEVNRSDWEAALALASGIETQFGSKAEADRYRDQIRGKRQESAREKINEIVAIIDRYTRSEQWGHAQREAEKLIGQFPDNEQVRNLPNEIEARRQQHKQQLLDSWNDAVARHDVDGSIEILKQLDTYLTPAEADAMQETARNIFREKREALGKQFATAVHDAQWNEAFRLGERIMAEFPNTRIAQEVREKMVTLRDRAAATVAASA